MNGRPRLCIDIDNVLARTDEVLRQVIRAHTAGRVDLCYEEVQEFDYCRCKDARGHSITKEEWQEIHALFSEPRYLWLIQPVDGVQDCLRGLNEKYELHLATARLPEARRTTIEWLEAHDFPPHSLHFLRHGEKHLSLGKFAAGVEDDRAQAEAFAGSGTPCYLLEHPWNLMQCEVEGVSRVANWHELAQHLLKLRDKR